MELDWRVVVQREECGWRDDWPVLTVSWEGVGGKESGTLAEGVRGVAEWRLDEDEQGVGGE